MVSSGESLEYSSPNGLLVSPVFKTPVGALLCRDGRWKATKDRVQWRVKVQCCKLRGSDKQ